MNKLVVLSLGSGDLYNGFPTVRALLWEPGNPYPMQFTGSLPKAPEIPEIYRRWQLLYLALYQRLGWSLRLEIEQTGVTNVSSADLSDFCQQLEKNINAWLNSETFRNIDQKLRSRLSKDEEIIFIIETDDNQLRRLPWHLWNFFEEFSRAEVALSAESYQREKKLTSKQTNAKTRILAILGNSTGIDIGKDRAFLEQLSNKVQAKFLVEPQLNELNEQLWKDWDILFFAGHSYSREKGLIQINRTEAIAIDELKHGLNRAINRGLKLAIFNSCDGLGLAQSLADLHIPQVIVMREPVPDVVAQEFLRHFLTAFSGGQSLYASVREARERLQGLERNFPCASWLPAICQNPAEVPMTWYETGDRAQYGRTASIATGKKQQIRSRCGLHKVLVVSLAACALVMGVRHLGMLQTWELQAFDQIMRLRSNEPPDPRLLVVTITEADIQVQNQKGRTGSLSDNALDRLLKKLKSYQPRVIGLDIYRDFPVEPKYKDLENSLRSSNNFIAICRVSNSSTKDPGVPPPPEIPQERLGFSDVVLDRDGILRRHLLAMTPEAGRCNTSYALSVQLAFRYLDQKGILPRDPTPEGYWQRGSTVFKPIDAHFGGYQGVDASGYQVLLNYRSHGDPQKIAPQVTLAEILRGEINPEIVKDKIVLIGVTATSAGDDLSTPYSAGQQSYHKIPGVIVQAQMVSQILSAVLDGRSLLWVFPLQTEALWIWGWSMVGGTIAYCLRSQLKQVLIAGSALGILYGICFGFLIRGGWVPLVPAAIALVVSQGTVVACVAYRVRRQQIN